MENRKQDSPQSGNEQNKGGSALSAASIGRSATAQVDPHSNSGLANTGTNISYEGPTAPGSGGSAGTGYTSGKEGVGETIATNSDYEQNRATTPPAATTNNSIEDEDDLDDDLEEVDYDEDEDDLEDTEDEDIDDLDEDIR